MIPYVHVEIFALGPVRLPAFLTLAGIGCLVGCAIAVWRGRRASIPTERIEEMCLWTLLAGYLGAHLGAWIYHPEESVPFSEPLLLLSAGVSSFGGFAGALLGLAAFITLRKVSAAERWRYADAISFAVPFGGLLGRTGCALVHDHPGLRTNSWLAVRYPDAPRWDLGLLEALFHAAFCAAFLWLGRKRRPDGFFFATFFLSYGIFRLAIDALRVDPLRYGPLTVDQWAGGSAVIVGVLGCLKIVRERAPRLTEIHPGL